MTEPEWMQVGRELLDRALGVDSNDIVREVGEVLRRVPHRDPCSTTISFSPGPCDCGRDAMISDIETRVAGHLAKLSTKETP